MGVPFVTNIRFSRRVWVVILSKGVGACSEKDAREISLQQAGEERRGEGEEREGAHTLCQSASQVPLIAKPCTPAARASPKTSSTVSPSLSS